MFVLITIAQGEIENPGNCIAIFGGKGSCEKIGIRQHIIIEQRNRAASASQCTIMVWVGNIHTFVPPKQAYGRVSSDNNVVATIIPLIYPCKIAGHPRYIVSGTGKTLGFFNAETSGTHRSHTVYGLSFILSGHHFHFFALNYRLFHFYGQNQFLTCSKTQVAKNFWVIAQVSYFDTYPSHRNVGEGKFTRFIGRNPHKGIAVFDNHIGSKQRFARNIIQNNTADILLKSSLTEGKTRKDCRRQKE